MVASSARFPQTAVATLIDAFLGEDADGFDVALELVHMYAFGRKEMLEGLRPQILKLAEQGFTQARCVGPGDD